MNIEKDLKHVNEILEGTDNMVTSSICHMYIELYEEYKKCGVIDKTKDNLDRKEAHRIAGGMNDPSSIQTNAFNKECSNDSEEH